MELVKTGMETWLMGDLVREDVQTGARARTGERLYDLVWRRVWDPVERLGDQAAAAVTEACEERNVS